LVLNGFSKTLTINVSANYTAALSFSISGAAFSLSAPSFCWLQCPLAVSFHAASSGPQNGTLVVTTTGSVASSITVPLTGIGFDIQLMRPSRPARSDAIVPGQSRQMTFALDTTRIPGEVILSCEVLPALAECEVSSASVSGGSGTHDLSVTLYTRRRLPRKLVRGKDDVDGAGRGTPSGAYTVRVTASFGDATRTIDFPLEVR
jgi:hypothetical protein